MPIRNYTTKISVAQTVGEIQEILAKYGASKIMLDYESGKPVAITFQISTEMGSQGVRMRVNVPGCMEAIKESGGKADMAQAERVAWRNRKDWVDTQLGMVAEKQATMAQIFLPYILGKNDQEVYELFRAKQLLLPEGQG